MKVKKLIVPTLLVLLGAVACAPGSSEPMKQTAPEEPSEQSAIAPSAPQVPAFDCAPLQGSYLGLLEQQADAQNIAYAGQTLSQNISTIQSQLPNVEACAISGDFSALGLPGPVRDPGCVATAISGMEPSFSQALTGTGVPDFSPYSTEISALQVNIADFRKIGEEAVGLAGDPKIAERVTNYQNALGVLQSSEANLATITGQIANAPGIISPKFDRAVQLFNEYSAISISNPGLMVSDEEKSSYSALLTYSEGVRTELNGLLQELYGTEALVPAPPAETSVHIGNWSFKTGDALKYLQMYTPQMTGQENNGFKIGGHLVLGEGSLFQQYDSLLDSVPGMNEEVAKAKKTYTDATDKLVESLGVMAFAPLQLTPNVAQIQLTSQTYANTASGYSQTLSSLQTQLVQNGCQVPVLEAASP